MKIMGPNQGVERAAGGMACDAGDCSTLDTWGVVWLYPDTGALAHQVVGAEIRRRIGLRGSVRRGMGGYACYRGTVSQAGSGKESSPFFYAGEEPISDKPVRCKLQSSLENGLVHQRRINWSGRRADGCRITEAGVCVGKVKNPVRRMSRCYLGMVDRGSSGRSSCGCRGVWAAPV